MAMKDLVLRQCNIRGTKELMDVAIHQGRIEAIGPQLPLQGAQELQCEGKLLSAPFVESHIHLDSVLTAGQPRWNSSGTLFEGIQIWAERKQSLSLEDVQARAIEALKLMASHGVLYVRTHADVTEPKLLALDALLNVREKVKDWITVQVVAFPQDGIYSNPKHEALLEEAIKRGADAVGGIPHYELTREDGVRSIHKIFDLAEQYDRLIDVHCDEIDDEQARFLEVIVSEAIKRGTGPRVAASHTTSFGSVNDAYAYKLMGFLKRTAINFIANPLINITLQGRLDTYPKRRGLTRVKELVEHGQNVSLGQDCIADPWYIFGTGNMLDVAHMTVHAAQMTGLQEIESCYDMVTDNGATTLAIEDYGIKEGNCANLVLLNAKSPFEAIRFCSTARYVISRGKLIAQTPPPQTSFDEVTFPSAQQSG